MGNPIQTIPISAAALREVDIIGTFRYAHTYSHAIDLLSRKNTLLPDLNRLLTHRFSGLENVERAFQLAGEDADGEGNLVLKVLVELRG